jgi:predicted kinase
MHRQSLKDLQEILQSTNAQIQKLGQRMSNEVTYGSVQIWNAYRRRREDRPLAPTRANE